MTNKELHDKFQQMMSGQVGDVLNRFEEAMEKIDGMEKTFETKLDNRFNELLARLPPPPPAAPHAPLQQQQQRLPPRRETALLERVVSLFSLAKLLVLLLILLWLLLLMWRRMIMREITRMRLIKIELRATTSTTTTRSSTSK